MPSNRSDWPPEGRYWKNSWKTFLKTRDKRPCRTCEHCGKHETLLEHWLSAGWREDKKTPNASFSSRDWIESRFCSRKCYNEHTTISRKMGCIQKKPLTQEHIDIIFKVEKRRDILKKYHKDEWGFDADAPSGLTAENLFEVLDDQEYWDKVSNNYSGDDGWHKSDAFKLVWCIPNMNKAHRFSRYGYIRVFQNLFPQEWAEFYDTLFWKLSSMRRIRLQECEEIGLLYMKDRDGNVNYKGLTRVIRYAIEDWEREKGRKMNIHDVESFYRFPSRSHEGEEYTGSDSSDNPTKLLLPNHWHEMFLHNENHFARRQFYGVYKRQVDFQRHLEQLVLFPDSTLSGEFRDERGRFAKRQFDFIRMIYRHVNEIMKHKRSVLKSEIFHHDAWKSIEIQREYVRRLMRQLCPNARITDNFPYDLSEKDISIVANLDTYRLGEDPYYDRFCNIIRNKKGDSRMGLKWVMDILWPDYVKDEVMWNHQGSLQQLGIVSHLQHVVSYMTMGKVRIETEARMKNKRGWDSYISGRHIRLDIAIPRFKVTNPKSKYYGQWVDKCVIEVQGPQHYKVMMVSAAGRSRYYQPIDETHPQWEHWSAIHEGLVHRDRKKKRRYRHMMVYIPLCKEAKAVKGVHKDLGYYNYRHLTSQNPKKGRHGLAELFEMQGKTTMGGLIREHIGVLLCA